MRLPDLLADARRLSWHHLGRRVTFYLPGMFVLGGVKGRYPALSITGPRCALACDHCNGNILKTMRDVSTPTALLETCHALADKGHHGVLLSGGCSSDGALPWREFLPAIERIKAETGMLVSVHCGLVDKETAKLMRDVGVDQALIDVIGSDETYRSVYHVDFGIRAIVRSMEALAHAGLPMAPHIVCGLDRGRMRGEEQAVEMIAAFENENLQQLVFVALMPLPGTAMADVAPPNAEEVAELMALARFRLPATPMSLGCARMRGHVRLELLALEAGINRLALPSDEALDYAMALGLNVRFQRTCCSVSEDLDEEGWEPCRGECLGERHYRGEPFLEKGLPPDPPHKNYY